MSNSTNFWVISIDAAESLANAAGACKHDKQIFEALKEIATLKAIKTVGEIGDVDCKDYIFFDDCLLIMKSAFECGFSDNDIRDWLESHEEATA